MTPEKDAEFRREGELLDKFRNAYRCELRVFGEFFQWRVFDRGRPIAQVNCIHQAEEFMLRDVSIESAVPEARSFWKKLCRRPPEFTNYQRRGIGSKLLPRVIAEARERGARRITGEIVAQDLAKFPGLPQFYERFGFIFTPRPEPGRIRGTIELPL